MGEGIKTFFKIVGLIIVVLFVVGIFMSNSSVDKSYSQSGSVEIGSVATLSASDLDSVLLAVDEESFDALIDASIARDEWGITELMLAGKIFKVDNHIEVLVLDRGLFKTKVRVREGGNVGKAGWISSEWVVK